MRASISRIAPTSDLAICAAHEERAISCENFPSTSIECSMMEMDTPERILCFRHFPEMDTMSPKFILRVHFQFKRDASHDPERIAALGKFQQAESLRRALYEEITRKLKYLRGRKEQLRTESLHLKVPPPNGRVAGSFEQVILELEGTMTAMEEELEKRIEEVCKLEQDLREANRSCTSYRNCVKRAQDELNKKIEENLRAIIPEDHAPEVMELKEQVEAILEQKKAAELEEDKLEAEIQGTNSFMDTTEPPRD
ncbi:uncharacterized protein LOC135388962 [Ornithodoros turicata]|uniref:uncharacterized protein LOC135388962 n=1 Tax=Ornithodoros turicata TaxID=34597 RepID=UPI0031386FDE